MEAYAKWRRVKSPKYLFVHPDTGASVGGGLAATVSLSLRTDGDENGDFETFKIIGTPDEMENLAVRIVNQAHEARRMLASNQAEIAKQSKAR